MKNIQLFDFNLQYPLHVDGETLVNRVAYAEFLIRRGYAFDPYAIKNTVANAVNHLSEDSVEKMFDAIEDSAKKTFSRGKRKKIEGEA
jgi:hypothetical protein